MNNAVISLLLLLISYTQALPVYPGIGVAGWESNLSFKQPDSNLSFKQPDSNLSFKQPDSNLGLVQPDSNLGFVQPDVDVIPVTSTVDNIHDMVVSTLLKAHNGIKGEELKTVTQTVATEADGILTDQGAILDQEAIGDVIVKVSKQIDDLGTLNGDLALLDRLANLLTQETDTDRLHTLLEAIKLVASTVAAEVVHPQQTIIYTHVPYTV